MNIFGIDTDTTSCARYHTDKHIVKMPLETAQMICFTYHHKDFWNEPTPELLMKYSAGHDKHPCTLWIRENLINFIWTCELLYLLLPLVRSNVKFIYFYFQVKNISRGENQTIL